MATYFLGVVGHTGHLCTHEVEAEGSGASLPQSRIRQVILGYIRSSRLAQTKQEPIKKKKKRDT